MRLLQHWGQTPGHQGAAAAVVADQVVLGLVVGEGHVALAALDHVAAVPAQDEGGRAAPVQEQDHLLAHGQRHGHGLVQRPAEDAAVAGLQLHAQVHHLHRRQAGVAAASSSTKAEPSVCSRKTGRATRSGSSSSR